MATKKFSLGDRVIRNPKPFKDQGRPESKRRGTIIAIESEPFRYRVWWSGQPRAFATGYMASELMPAPAELIPTNRKR